MDIAHLCHLCHFPEIPNILGAVLKIHNTIFRSFKFGGQFFGHNFQTTYRNVTNDIALERY